MTTTAATTRKNNYASGNGMMTSIWGPSTWHLLHTMSFNYPVTPDVATQRQYRDFILGLRHVLPCGKCRANLAQNFRTLPLTMHHMRSRNTFSRYIFRLHELVNSMLDKTSGLTYEAVRDRYEAFRSRCATAATTTTAATAATTTTAAATKKKHQTSTQKHSHGGCTEPQRTGVQKQKCVLKIVPLSRKIHHSFGRRHPTHRSSSSCRSFRRRRHRK